MALSDRLAETTAHRGPRCTFPLFLDTLPADLRAECETLMADPAVAHNHLWRALRQELEHTEGYPMAQLPSVSTLTRHRQGLCMCSRQP
jgi:hypothetical protein